MTNRERMLAVYRNQLPDVLPVCIYKRYLLLGSQERNLRSFGLGIFENYPIMTLLAPPWHIHPTFTSEVKGAEFSVRYTWEDGKPVEVRVYETKVGNLHQRIIKDPMYGSDWVSKFYIVKPEDYKIMQYIVENTVFRSNEKGLKTRIKDMGDDGVVLGRLDRSPFQKLMTELAGPETFLMDICSGLKEAEDLLAVMAARQEEVFDAAAQSAAEVIWQPENLTGDMTSPPMYEKYCLPFYKKLAKKLEGTNKPYAVHFDGRLNPLRNLIAKSPFNCIDSFSYPEIGNNITLAEGRQAWPNKVILPNFPSSLCSESKEKICEYLKAKLAEAGKKKAYMLQISEDIPHEQWQRVIPIIMDFMNANARTV